MKIEDLLELEEHEEGNLFIGLFYGTVLSVPLWISLFGWIKIIANLIN